jgi:hypothetical protein
MYKRKHLASRYVACISHQRYWFCGACLHLHVASLSEIKERVLVIDGQAR